MGGFGGDKKTTTD